MQAGSTLEPLSPSIEYPEAPRGIDHRASELARTLGLEFSAPIGMLGTDSSGRPSWMTRVGSDAVCWPDSGRAIAAVVDLGFDDGGVTLWLPGPAEDHLWLILQAPALQSIDDPESTLWVGFGLSAAADRSPARHWGPSIPAQALLAWGRDVVSRLRLRAGSSERNAGRSDSSAIRSRFRIPERLSREMHISEPPKRFQRLAVELLREELNVEAVAWVPRSRREPVILDGEVAGLNPEAFRLLLPTRSDQAEQRWGDDPIDNDGIDGVRQALVISSESDGVRAGWIVAVNPIDGRRFGNDEADLLRPVAGLIASQRINSRHYAELKDLLFGIIRSLTAAIDAKDPYTLGHSERVGRIAVQLGEYLGLSTNQRGDLYLCGLLHDVGKIGICDAILQKAGPLTPEEFAEIKRHPTIGVQILSDLKKLHHLLPGVAHHHENFDGTGYPDGLSGHDIPQIARILAVADAFDAMSSTRPYRRRLASDQIDRIFENGSGTQWDPEVVDALFCCRDVIEHIRQKGLGQSVVQAVDDTINRSKDASYLADSVIGPPSSS